MTASNTTRISMIRHGHVHNPNDVIYGRLPGFRLSEKGRRQVERTADHLQDANLAVIFASPQLRAQQTAAVIQQHHPDVEIVTEPLIDEVKSFFEGHPASEIEKRGWDLYTGVEEGDYESPSDVASRAWQFIRRVRRAYHGSHVAAVCHGDVIAFAVLRAMQEPIEIERKRTLARFGVTDGYPATATITTVSFNRETPGAVPQITYVKPYNDDLHVDSLS